MQINTIGSNPNSARKLDIPIEKQGNSSGVQQQIEALKKEIEHLRQKRANPVASGEIHDENGTHQAPVDQGVVQKIRAEIDQKIQRLQIKIQLLESQNSEDSSVNTQQNITKDDELQEISHETLQSLGEVGKFIDERV